MSLSVRVTTKRTGKSSLLPKKPLRRGKRRNLLFGNQNLFVVDLHMFGLHQIDRPDITEGTDDGPPF
jgi:hypothetical protein